MKILHIFHFEKKFVIVAAEIFDACKKLENSFKVLSSNVAAAKDFFAGRENISVVEENYVSSEALRNDIMWCDCLVVHYMDELKAKAVLSAPRDLPIIWSGWGGDYYDLINPGEKNLLSELTQNLTKEMETHSKLSVKNLNNKIKNFARNARNKIIYVPRIKKAINRTNYFSTPFPEDYYLARENFGGQFQAVYTRIFYGSVERTYMPGAKEIYGTNILVGNSATATNNHLDSFKLLSALELGDRRIVVPLSYGDARYRKAIIAHGRELFGDRFCPIVDFMPLDQYNTLIAQCSVVVMGHRRQQGGGNTVTQLYKGAKVFLDEANTVYQYLKNRGAFVNTLSELKEGREHVLEPLTKEQIHTNRAVLDAYSSNAVVSNSMNELVRQLRTRMGFKIE
jgi:dTDP-N-acetylfucosamine:lipid II N-acetylfucosaminyltransferase